MARCLSQNLGASFLLSATVLKQSLEGNIDPIRQVQKIGSPDAERPHFLEVRYFTVHPSS